MGDFSQSQFAQLDWREGHIPVSRQFDDLYYSTQDGLAETAHVFLAGNGLPGRFVPGFHVAELGFGTGLNLLAIWQAWVQSGQTGPLRFTSFEAYPMTARDMQKSLAGWPELSPFADVLLAAWGRGQTRIVTDTLHAQVIIGDARQTLPAWQGRADAWCLDGFSPAKNPELWEADLMEQVARHTKPHGSFATYSAAGHVRSGLQAAGFAVTRAIGHGRKRHMTKGTLKPDP
jgi:tRNA U34 5-methylaminomethyl-2-thiouridine-forming methyltransferase MnmC